MDNVGGPFPHDLLNVEDIVAHIWDMQSVNFNYLIEGLCLKPYFQSKFSISRCWLRPLHVVRSILKLDVQLLENEFVNGYMKGNRVLYVSPFDNDEKTMNITNEDI